MTGLCKDCQYWEKDANGWQPRSRACLKISGPYMGAKAFAEDEVAFFTDADFGCVEFKPKGTEPVDEMISRREHAS